MKKYRCIISSDMSGNLLPEAFFVEELLLLPKLNLHPDPFAYPEISDEDSLVQEWGYTVKDKTVILLTDKEYEWLLNYRYNQAMKKVLRED